MASVSSGSKMYRTSAAREIHVALHFGQKSRMYIVNFAEYNNTLFPR